MSLATCATGRPDALANPVPRMIGSFGYFLALGLAGESYLQRDRSSQTDRSIRCQLSAGETVFRFRRACDPGRRERRLGAGTRTHRACFACATRSRFRDRLRARFGRLAAGESRLVAAQSAIAEVARQAKSKALAGVAVGARPMVPEPPRDSRACELIGRVHLFGTSPHRHSRLSET
jgi:hypothetical protein